jgi:hypothetical protein
VAAVDTTSASDDLTWALRSLRDEYRLNGYRIAESYYDGRHDLRFATDKWRSTFGYLFRTVCDNLCPAVVDSVSDRLRVIGVSSEEQAIADAATAIWQRNRMDIRAPETHHESLLNGDGYALVWPDKSGEAVIWSLPAHEVSVAYDRNQPGVITRAARLWQDVDGDWRWHLDLYYPERVERWISRNSPRTVGSMPSSYSTRNFEPWLDGCADLSAIDGWASWLEGDNSLGDGYNPTAAITNPLGRVPIVHFPNRRYHTYGISELATVLPLQDALNKAVCDMLVAMEFSAFPQRWATGIEVDEEPDSEGKTKTPPFEPGQDRIFAVANDQARFGDFRETNLQGYVEVQENLRSEIARVSGTPLHYLFITRGDFPSGEAMKSAEARFTRKVENRQTAYGNQWENVLAMAVQLENPGDGKIDPAVVTVEWESASPLATDVAGGEPVPATVSATERI